MKVKLHIYWSYFIKQLLKRYFEYWIIITQHDVRMTNANKLNSNNTRIKQSSVTLICKCSVKSKSEFLHR